MPNRNYERGVRWERKLKKQFESAGYIVLRTAGSHGPVDLVCIGSCGNVNFIQCKVVKTKAQANNLIKKFQKDLPLPRNNAVGEATDYLQYIYIWISNERRAVSG